MAKVLLFNVRFEGTVKTAKELAALEKQIRLIGDAMKKAISQNDLVRWRKLGDEMAKMKTKASQLRAEMQKLATTMRNLKYPTGSLAALERAYAKTQRAIDRMSKSMTNASSKLNNQNFAALEAKIAALQKKLNQLGTAANQAGNAGNGRVGGGGGGIGRAATSINRSSAIGGFASGIAQGSPLLNMALMAGPAGAVGLALAAITIEATKVNTEISGLQASVRKTTGLNVAAVERITETLADIKTPTSLVDLLKIAEQAGRFGIQGEQAVIDFTTALNGLSIALGDEFSGGVEQITVELSHLALIMYGVTSDGTVMADRFNKIGNSLNVLANAGSATAEQITDIANRIAGVGKQYGYTEGQILGIATSMKELGINVERGSTAFIRFNTSVRANRAEVAKYIGISSKQLKEMLDTKPYEAFKFIITRINETAENSGSNLATILANLRLQGAGVSEFFTKMGNNLGFVDKRINQATSSLTNMNSILKEQANMLESIPGQWSVFWNTIKNSLVDSGFANAIKDAIKEINGLFYLLSEARKGKITYGEVYMYTQKDKDGNLRMWDYIEKDKKAKLIQEETKKFQGGLLRRDPNFQGAPYNFTSGKKTYVNEGIKSEIEIQTDIIKDSVDLLDDLNSGYITKQKYDKLTEINVKKDLESKKRLKKLIAEFNDPKLIGDADIKRDGPAGPKGRKEKEPDIFEKGSLYDLEKRLNAVNDLISRTKAGTAKYEKLIEQASILNSKIAVAKLIEEQRRNFFGPDYRDRVTYTPLDKLPTRNTKITTDQLKDLTKSRIRFAENKVRNIDRDFLSGKYKNIDSYGKAREKQGLDSNVDIATANLDNIYANRKDYTSEEITKAEDDLLDAKIARETYEADKKLAIRQALADATINLAQQVADAVFDIESNDLEDKKERELKVLEAFYKDKLNQAAGNATLEKAIQNELEEKKAEVELKYKKKQQQLAIKQAIINTALAVISAATTTPFIPLGIIAMAGAAAAGALQVATIRSQKLARGGKYFSGRTANVYGRPDETGETPAEQVQLHGGEYVMPRRQVNKYPELVNALDAERNQLLRGYAFGGRTSRAPQITRPYGSASIGQGGFSVDMIDRLVNEVGVRVYEAALAGTSAGASNGTYNGLSNATRNNERQSQLKKTTEY